jgi:CheY-like chemotaxis protein
MNLVTNAAEAMPDGGTIYISTQNIYLDQPVEGYDEIEEGDYVVLKISDSGIGISPADKERIFEPFYTKKIMGRSGTGLGMAVVWGTVKDHKGYIDLRSTEGQGTTVTLYFPIIREPLADDQSAAALVDSNGHGKKILVVDDIEEQRHIATLMLRKMGYDVNAVPGGAEAIEFLQDHSADLIVLDMIMDPGIDGLETFKQILRIHPDQKAIIASGFSETWRVKEAQRLGAGAYVKKPYTLENIGQAVNAELGK